MNGDFMVRVIGMSLHCQVYCKDIEKLLIFRGVKMIKKKITLIYLLIGVTLAVLLFLFLFRFFTQPLFATKVFELCQDDLRENLPKGHFQKVSIVWVPQIGSGKKIEEIIFEVPADKMKEFEAGFRKCAQSAIPLKGDPGRIIVDALRIQADRGKYSACIDYDDKEILIYGGFFHRGFISKDLRKVFYDAGLKYDSEKQPAQEKEANQPLQKRSE
jgi:hypothetical protein